MLLKRCCISKLFLLINLILEKNISFYNWLKYCFCRNITATKKYFKGLIKELEGKPKVSVSVSLH